MLSVGTMLACGTQRCDGLSESPGRVSLWTTGAATAATVHCCDSGDGHAKARIDAAPHPLCRCSSPHLVVRHQISCQDSSTAFVVVSHPASHARLQPAPRIATRLTGSLFWVKTVSDAPRGLARRPHTAWLALPVGACATSSTTHLPPSTFEPTLANLVRLWRCCRDHESGLEADFTQALSGCAHHLRPRRTSARLFWILHPPASVGRLFC